MSAAEPAASTTAAVGDPQQAEYLHGPVVQHQVLRCATLTAVEQEGIPQQRERERNDGEQAVSAGGRYVVFASAARNLVPGDTTSTSDVFVRDLVR